MDSKCTACGFVNPEGSGFCSLCGVPFIGPVRGPAPSVIRAPQRVKGESAEMDPATLERRLDEEPSTATRQQEELLRELARLVPESKADAEDELDGLVSDYDGNAVLRPPGVPATGTGHAGGVPGAVRGSPAPSSQPATSQRQAAQQAPAKQGGVPLPRRIPDDPKK